MIDWSEGPQYASDCVDILKSFNLVDPQFADDDCIPDKLDGVNVVDAISRLGMAINKAMLRLKEASTLVSSEGADKELRDQWLIESKSLITHLNFLMNGKVEVTPEPDQAERNQVVIDLVSAIQEKKMVNPRPQEDPRQEKGRVLSFSTHGRTFQ